MAGRSGKNPPKIKAGILVKREDFTVAQRICQETYQGIKFGASTLTLFTGCASGAC